MTLPRNLKELPDWALLTPPPPLLDVSDLATADDVADPARLYFLHRLSGGVLRGLRLLHARADSQHGRSLSQLAEGFALLDAEARFAAVDDPVFHYEWLKAMECVRDADPEELDTSLRALGRLFLIPLLKAGVAEGITFSLAVSEGVLHFPGLGVRVRLGGDETSGSMRGEVRGEELILRGQGSERHIPTSALLDGPRTPDTLPQSVVPRSAITVDATDPAVRRLFQSLSARGRNEGVIGPNVAPMDPIPDHVIEHLGEALELLELAEPGFARELKCYTKLVVPFSATRLSTFVEIAFMGAVFMSESHRPFSDIMFTAEHLLHEHSHLRLAVLMELDPLFDAEDGALFASPWRRDPRPLWGLVQGTFVFARVARFLNRASEVTGEPRFAARRAEVVAELTQAVNTLTTSGVRHTPVGMALIEQYRAEAETATVA